MHAYQVQVNGVNKKWAGSMAECRAAKPQLIVDGIAARPGEITYVEVEVPTDKAGLLAYLNKIMFTI